MLEGLLTPVGDGFGFWGEEFGIALGRAGEDFERCGGESGEAMVLTCEGSGMGAGEEAVPVVVPRQLSTLSGTAKGRTGRPFARSAPP